MTTGTGEVLIETLLTEATDSVQVTTGVKTLPVSTQQDDVLRLAKATLGCKIDDADKSVTPDVLAVEESKGDETNLKHFLPSELVYDSKNSPNGLPQ